MGGSSPVRIAALQNNLGRQEFGDPQNVFHDVGGRGKYETVDPLKNILLFSGTDQVGAVDMAAGQRPEFRGLIQSICG